MSLGAISGYGYDPYFMAAYQSYNPNFKGTGATSVGNTQATTSTSPTVTTSPTFQARKEEVENSGSAAKMIVGGLAAIGTGVLLYKAHKKGGQKGICEGFKQMWKGITGKTDDATKETFKMQKNADGKWYCTIPNRKQRIDLTSVDAKKTTQKLGLDINETIKFGDKNTKAFAFEFTHNGNVVQVRGDKIVSYKNPAGDDIMSKLSSEVETDVKYKKELQSIIAKINKGETKIDDVTLNKVYYNHTSDGVTRRFIQEADDVTLNKIITNRHTLDSDAVTAYRRKNANIDEAIKQIEKGKIPENNLTIASAECVIDGRRLKIENGEVVGIFNGDKLKGKDSDEFLAWLYNHPKALEEVKNLTKDKKLQNIIYQAA